MRYGMRSLTAGMLVAAAMIAAAPMAMGSESSEKGAKAPTITIDAKQTGEPISKYIYGQFIEHLGRCIYGGIWAEMLEDRKFFSAAGSKTSPWKVIGDSGAVRMSQEKPFVGEHTPEIALPGGAAGGIVQDGLGLREGKDYVGRIWLAGKPEAGPVRVSMIWGDGPKQRQTVEIALSGDYAMSPLSMTVGGSTDNGRLEIVSEGKGTVRVGTVSLMPADNVKGMRADTLKLLKGLDSPVYRWPGGNFVSGYNWKDGIGDRDRRPPRKNPAWKGIEHNDFGIDEYMTFCREVGTEPLVVVNSGLGKVESAVEELEYANGDASTPMGKLRAANGHPEPYGVKFWGIGNEMYGKWQLGHMPIEEYVKKNNLYADAMRKADPTITLIAVGSVGPWSEAMMAHCADHMDLISEHFYCQEKPGLLDHVRQAADRVRQIAEAHRRYRQEIGALKGKDIRIALDEWNYWYGKELYGQIGPRYFVKDGLGVAMALNEFARQSDIMFMANYAQTVNVIGAIKTSKTDAAMETTGLVLEVYRRHFGTIPVAAKASATLDVAAAWSPDRKKLVVAVVNPTQQSVTADMDIQNAKWVGSGHYWRIAGKDPMEYNEPGEPLRVKIVEGTIDGKKTLTALPLSVTLFALDME